MRDTFSLLFFPKGNDIDKLGKVPLYMRITVNSRRSELSIKRKIDPSKWNPEANKLRGSGEDSKAINKYLSDVRNKIYRIHEKLIIKGKPFTAQTIRNKYLNVNDNRKTLLSIFQEHNNQIEQLVGKEFSYGAYMRYVRTKRHLENYVAREYNAKDIFVKEIDLKFITNFEYYLKFLNIGNQNTVTKYVTNFKKIMRIAFANNWINKDPFFHWKAKWKVVEREALTELEMQKMMEKEISTPRLNQVKDIFLFCCFTGLAYVDVKKLSSNHIVLVIDGERWIKINRSKTDTRSSIPLLPTAEAILDRYKYHNENSKNELLLPVISNQRMNAYLKEIADLCGINKNLTFHLARHTFATTVTLTNGVPIESVSKMLGHKSLKTTQIYAKIIDRKLSDDMKILRDKFKQKSNKSTNEVV